MINREKVLLRELFEKRKSLSLRYDDAYALVEYKDSRLEYLIDRGVVRRNGDFLEMDEVYLSFFEDVLEVNEVIGVGAVKDRIDQLQADISDYLKESGERRRYEYLKKVKKGLRQIAHITMRSVVDLKRNVDNTYKNEPSFEIKRDRLKRLDEKTKGITDLIKATEDLIETRQPTFFSVAMDADMNAIVTNVRYSLGESYHSVIEIQRQIIIYLNLIEYQNRIVEKLRSLKYLKDQMTLEQDTSIREMLFSHDPIWMESPPRYSLRLSLDYLRNSDEAPPLLVEAARKIRSPKSLKRQDADPIPNDMLREENTYERIEDLSEVKNAFMLQRDNLFSFISGYHFPSPPTQDRILVMFCQIAVMYCDELEITSEEESSDGYRYPLIYPR